MRRVYFAVLVVILAFGSSDGNAQSRVLDSLRGVIEKHPEQDSMRIELIMDYMIAATNDNTSDFLPYMNEILTISKRTNYRRGLQRGYMVGQIYFGDRAQYEKAFLYGDSAFAVLKGDTTKGARQSLGHLYNNIGTDYYKLGDYDKALEYWTNSAMIFEPLKHTFLSAVYGNLAEVYQRLHNPAKTDEYLKKSIAVAESSGIERMLAPRLLNYSTTLILRGEFAEATKHMTRVEPMVMRLDNTFLLAQFYYNTAYIDKSHKDYSSAVANYKKALHYVNVNEDIQKKAEILEVYTDCLIDMNRMGEAKAYLDTMLMLSNTHSLKPVRKSAFLNLAKWHKKAGRHKDANEYLERYMALSDSLFSEQSNEKIAALEVRYNVEKNVREIGQLKAESEVQQLTIEKKDTLNYVLIGSAITLLIILSLSFWSYKQKQRLQQQRISELETEKQLTATEAVLKGEDQERTRLAKDLHDGLGGMLSGIKHSFNTMKGNLVMTPENQQAFERSMDMLDSSIKEMRRVAHNMMPEALVRFGLDTALKDYCNDINQGSALRVSYQSIGNVDENLNQTMAIAIYRIIQELIANTMKHAAAKSMIIQITKADGLLSVTVEDDGKGFDISIIGQSKGIGWTNIQNRVDFLKGRWDVSSDPGAGTSVHIEFSI